MIKLRLRRMGRKGQPHYRIVAAEARWPRDGRFIEAVGYYNPRTEPATIQVNAERARYWLEHGAQPTETVRSILVKAGVLPGRQPEAAEKPASSQKPSGPAASAAPSEAAAEQSL